MPEILIGLLIAAALFFGFYWFVLRRRQRNWERISLLSLSISLLSVLILSCVGAYKECSTGWEWVFNGIEVVFQVFDGDSDAFRAYAAFLPAIPELLSCAVPLLTVSTALSLLWNYLPHHVPICRKVWYIFSEMDANSIRMATSLGTGDHLCIFLRSRRDKLDPELLKELQDIRYFLYPKDETRFLLWPWRRKHILRFFFLSENTDENFNRMQAFITAIQNRNLFDPYDISMPDGQFQHELYLLSETESAPMLIDHLRTKLNRKVEKTNRNGESRMETVRKEVFHNTELRLLDRFRATSYALLREKPLHKYAHNDKLNILILGFGRIGREFFRAACALGILHNRDTTFTLCDQQLGSKLNMFLSQCPELDQSVTIHKRQLNIESDALEALATAGDYHYIVVALGDDERNIRVASRLKRFYRLRHWKALSKNQADAEPQICVNIEDAIKHDYTLKLWTDAMERDNSKDWDKGLHVFGGLEQVFAPKVLMPRDLWTAARCIHRELCSLPPDRRLNWGEYERRSSIACAVRAEYLCDSVCGDKKRREYENMFSPEDQSNFADTEHLRWMAYVRSEGLCHADTKLVDVYYDKDFGNHVDILGKLTPCLTEDLKKLEEVWTSLSTGEHAADYKNKKTFRWRDERLVELAGEIARLADPEK